MNEQINERRDEEMSLCIKGKGTTRTVVEVSCPAPHLRHGPAYHPVGTYGAALGRHHVVHVLTLTLHHPHLRERERGRGGRRGEEGEGQGRYEEEKEGQG